MVDYLSYPFVAQATTDVEFSQMFTLIQRTGVVGTVGSSALGGSANGTGMTTTVATGAAWVLGFYFGNTTPLTLLHDAATANPRIDRVVLRLNLSSPLVDRITPVVIKGEPAASNPAVPSLTQIFGGVWEFPLYRVAIDATVSTIAANKLTDERRYIGQQLGQWTTATRPSPPSKYDAGFNETLGYWEFYDGSAWQQMGKGTTWANLAGKPATSTLDGRNIFVSDIAPTNAQGVNGDIWLEY